LYYLYLDVARAGEVALPGGRHDAEDNGDDATAALREAFEEIALPCARVYVAGSMPPLPSKVMYGLLHITHDKRVHIYKRVHMFKAYMTVNM
jgi:8-oxo-dGTP pyrophosphatase MutT (NUDIX family)